jgi:hypothetical protein
MHCRAAIALGAAPSVSSGLFVSVELNQLIAHAMSATSQCSPLSAAPRLW